jgi:hypothetical protein
MNGHRIADARKIREQLREKADEEDWFEKLDCGRADAFVLVGSRFRRKHSGQLCWKPIG